MPIGEALARARREAGRSVEQVSDATRIRAAIIAAIEAEDFTRSGGDVYARGHIRAIARTLGVDPEPLVAEYDATYGDSRPHVREIFEAETHSEPEPRGPNWSAAMAAALVLVLVYVGVQLLTGDGGGRETTTLGEPTPAASAGAGGAASSSPRPSARAPRDAVAAADRDGVRVELTTPEGASWVGVTDAEGDSVFQGLVEEGEKRTFTDKRSLRLVIGNAGAVALTVNGEKVGAPGSSGEVVRVEFGPDDPVSG